MTTPVTVSLQPPAKGENTEQSSQPRKKVSWVNVINNKPSLSKHEYEVTMVDGATMVEIPDEIVQNSVPLWEEFLEGHFIGDAPHVAKVHVIVNKI